MPVLQYRLSTRAYNGQAEVLARFFSGHSFAQRAKCRVFCPVSAWDEKLQQLSVPRKITQETAKISELQNKLDAIRNHIIQRWFVDQYTAEDGWLQQTIDEFMQIPTKKERKRVSDIVLEYADHKDPSSRMRDQYRVLQKILQEYESKHIHVYTDNFTPERVEEVFEYYRTRPKITKNGIKEMRRSNNTMSSKERMLARVCDYAVHQKYMSSSPFGSREHGLYQAHVEIYGDIFYLTKEERDMLAQAPMEDEMCEKVRDMFVFQCHVGCRVSDMLSLTTENIQDGFLQYIPIKTRGVSAKVVRVPLDEVASSIISKYKGGPKLLPLMTDVTYNRYIHIVTKKAGLTRKVMVLKNGKQETHELWEVCTSHTARKTFAQQIFKYTKSEVVSSSFTGHSPNTRVFGRYAEVDDEMKNEIISKLSAK